MKNSYFKCLSILCISILFSACGGGGGGSSSSSAEETLTGVFIDSPVQGLRWVSGSTEGTTDVAGAFQYKSGAIVQFYVGDIYLGETTGDSILTPIDLIDGALDSSNPTVTNIIRFLMTLDDDGTPSNGIEITKTVADLAQGETMNFAQTTSDFAAAGDIEILVASLTAARTASSQVLASVSDARSHFSNSMGTLLAGDYSGTWSGDGSGAWSGIVTTGGIFTGTGTGSEGTVNFTGTVSTDGSGTSTFGSTSDGSTFAGTIGLDGTMSGTWTDGFYTGTYSGSKVESSPPTWTSGCSNVGNSICVPSTTTHQINADETKNMTFTLEQAGTVTIYTSGDLDTELSYFRDGTGSSIAANSYSYSDDISDTNYNFRISVTDPPCRY